jgi:hypothetical protein
MSLRRSGIFQRVTAAFSVIVSKPSVRCGQKRTIDVLTTRSRFLIVWRPFFAYPPAWRPVICRVW